MILRCVISYTTPDGDVFNAGVLYTVEVEQGAWLLAAAEGQFVRADDAETQDLASARDTPLDQPPADRQVGGPPAGGAPRTRRR